MDGQGVGGFVPGDVIGDAADGGVLFGDGGIGGFQRFDDSADSGAQQLRISGGSVFLVRGDNLRVKVGDALLHGGLAGLVLFNRVGAGEISVA